MIIPEESPTADAVLTPFPWQFWFKRFLACNPFYLLSAALLLYGVCRLSVDPVGSLAEGQRLTMNFSLFQLYELLLVVTAIFLARRLIWYDATLLLGLENLFVLIPFVLVTCARFDDWESLSRTTCIIAAVLALAKFGSIKRFIQPLNLPSLSLGIGIVVLCINAILPTVSRSFLGEGSDVAQRWVVQWWICILPLPLLLANLLPTPRQWTGPVTVRGWFPLVLIALWTIGTGAHLWCIGYVYDVSWKLYMVAPVVWIATWTLYFRLTDFVPGPSARNQSLMLIPPAVACALAARPGAGSLFAALCALNVLAFGIVAFLNRDKRLAFDLLLASLAATVAGLPVDVATRFIPDTDRGELVAAAFITYGILQAIYRRVSPLGLIGAIGIALGSFGLMRGSPGIESGHLAVQFALIFFLGHSLFWDDRREPHTRGVQAIGALGWIIHSIIWVHSHVPNTAANLTALSFTLLLVYFLVGLLRHRWESPIIPAAALLVLCVTPIEKLIMVSRTTSLGMLAVVGSLVLFALGTVLALTKSTWNEPPPVGPV